MDGKSMAVVTTLALAAGCQTPYQTMGPIRGGYEDNPAGPGMFVVHVKVNSFTSRGRAMAYAHQRASELCPQGYGLVQAVNEVDANDYNKPEVTIAVRCAASSATDEERQSGPGWWCTTISSGVGACYRDLNRCEARREDSFATDPTTSQCGKQSVAFCFQVRFPAVPDGIGELCGPTRGACDGTHAWAVGNPQEAIALGECQQR